MKLLWPSHILVLCSVLLVTLQGAAASIWLSSDSIISAPRSDIVQVASILEVDGLDAVVIHCRNMGNGRKAVWINSRQGTFALNGQAISWVQDAEAMGTPIVGSDGQPAKLGRDHLPTSLVGDLITRGLEECD